MTKLPIVPEGWTSIDDGENSAAVSVQSPVETVVTPTLHDLRPRTDTTQDAVITQYRSRPHLSAAVGILLVLIGAGFYFGVLNLRGSINDVPAGDIVVTIDEAGTFDPSLLTVEPGDTIRFENKNGVPQVIKPQEDSPLLFQPLAIITEPMVALVPADAVPGTYVYTSSTLSADAQLTVTVTPRASDPTPPLTVPSESIPVPPSTPSMEIPLPFGGPVEEDPTPAVLSVSAKEQSTTAEPETAVVTLHSAANEEALPPLSGQALPTNPHTVANAPATPQESLHSGAPLFASPRAPLPPSVSATGPASWIAFICLSLAALVCWRWAKA